MPLPPFEDIVSEIAFQHVVLARARQVLDAAQEIALGVSARARSCDEADRDAGSRSRIARRVDAKAPMQRVGAPQASQHIVAAVAGDDVVQRIAGAVDVAGAFEGQVLDLALDAR